MAKILDNSKELKTLALQTTNENKITYHLEKTPFSLSENTENIINSLDVNSLEVLHQNDIWNTFNINFTEQNINQVKVCKFTDHNDPKVLELVRKPQILVKETPEIYRKMNENIEFLQESYSIESTDHFFGSIPKFKIFLNQNYIESNKNPKNFTLKIIPENPLKIRDLNVTHIEIFQKLEQQVLDLIDEKTKINKNMLH